MTINQNCLLCGTLGLDLNRPGFRTCPVSDCAVDQFKIHGERFPHPLEEKVQALLNDVEFREDNGLSLIPISEIKSIFGEKE